MSEPVDTAPDGYVFDIDAEQPDRNLEGLRQWVRNALAGVRNTTVTTGDLELMLTALQQLSDAYLAAVADSVADRAELRDRVAVLETQVAAMQNSLGG